MLSKASRAQSIYYERSKKEPINRKYIRNTKLLIYCYKQIVLLFKILSVKAYFTSRPYIESAVNNKAL